MPTRYRPILILAFIAAISYLAVDIFYTIVSVQLVRTESSAVAAPAPARTAPKRAPKADHGIIVTRNLFGSAQRAMAGKQSLNVDDLQQSSMNFLLLGTVAGEGDFGYAIIQDGASKQQKLYKTGDSVGSARLEKVMRGKVVLNIGGRNEVLTMIERPVGETGERATASAAPALPERQNIPVKKQEVDSALQDLSAIMSDVRVRPNFTDGKPDGFMVTRIKEGSLFSKMGMKNGDIIRGVNDKPLGTADDMLAFYQQLKSGSKVNLNIRRQGRDEVLQYTFQ